MAAKLAAKNQRNQKRKPLFYRRKGFLWLVALLVGPIVITLLAFQLSPWPGALIIRLTFEMNSRKMTQALQAHEPKSGITTISDQQYKSGDNHARLDVYLPSSTQTSSEKLPVVIWTHGGAWLSGDKTDFAPYYKLLALQGYTVIVPDYSLAPEKTYPTPIQQLNAMYTYIQENAERFHADTQKMVLAGDSAGAQLSAQMAALVTNPDYAKNVGLVPTLKPEQLRGVVLNCGIYKMEQLAHPNPNLSKLIGWGNDVTVWAYSGTHDFSDPVIRQMSPYYHVTKAFPPTYISGGNADPLTDVQSKPFADELQALGVSVTRLFYESNHIPALSHEYQFNLDNQDGQIALHATLAFLKTHTK